MTSTTAPYLGLDIGLKRTGVAISESGIAAEPLTTIEWNQPQGNILVEQLVQLVLYYKVNTIIAGLPLGIEDDVTDQSCKTTRVINQLKTALSKQALLVQIITINEFNTTQDAVAKYPKVDKDAAAAAIILQDYLELQGGT